MSRKCGVKCEYFNCGKTARSDSKLKLYRFPKNQELCHQWVQNTGIYCYNNIIYLLTNTYKPIYIKT